jgi:hypothetical protein
MGYLAAYQKKWRKVVDKQVCICGKPATINRSGYWICKACDKPTPRKDYAGKKREAQGNGGGTRTEKFWDGRSGEVEEAPLCGASLVALEAKLALIQPQMSTDLLR